MSDIVGFEISIGRPWCAGMRSMLNELKFKGHSIEYFEGSGLWYHKFVIRGDREPVQWVVDRLKKWAGE